MTRATADNLPPRPSPRRERAALKLFLAFSPKLRAVARTEPPASVQPCERFEIARDGASPLPATWYPAPGRARGVVLLAHPWVGWGQSYFHRGGRLEALRAAGYHAATFDLSAVAGEPVRAFFDLEVEAALTAVRARAPGLPLHVWGVSAGGFWAHPAVARDGAVAGAFFEDVSPHLFEWAARAAPAWTPFYWLFRRLFPDGYRFLDLRRHAPHLGARAVSYLSGGADVGVRPEDTAELAALAGAASEIVDGASHLGSIKRDPERVAARALATFARAER